MEVHIYHKIVRGKFGGVQTLKMALKIVDMYPMEEPDIHLILLYALIIKSWGIVGHLFLRVVLKSHRHLKSETPILCIKTIYTMIFFNYINHAFYADSMPFF